MLSWPPATMTSASPARIACAASITALSPDPHTLFTVNAGTLFGIPARIAACRAGFWPRPAVRTLPRITSSMAVAGTPARRSASWIASAPSSGAENPVSEPWNLPIGVRQALAMTTSLKSYAPVSRQGGNDAAVSTGRPRALRTSRGRRSTKPGDQYKERGRPGLGRGSTSGRRAGVKLPSNGIPQAPDS